MSKNIICANCGYKGHVFKECYEPVTSFGIICYRWVYEKKDDFVLDNFLQKITTPTTDYPIVKFLMIQRKDTMGFIDFMRGKYNNYQSILILFNEMTNEEKYRLQTCNFDELWDKLWINHNNKYYKNEYDKAKRKFNNVNIDMYISVSDKLYNFQEFGFPKGRRNIKESNLECAKREFFEETGYSFSQYTILNDTPFEENFIGTNGIKYRHVYYLARLNNNSLQPKVDISNLNQIEEVQNIGFFSFSDCQNLIRPYDIAKKKILLKVYDYINDIKYRYYFSNEYLIEAI